MVTLSPRVRDHPRSRGVDSTGTSRARSSAGSSPLARGRPRLRDVPHESVRIIPARAGSTEEARRGGGCPQDHPRSRGVDKVGEIAKAQRTGSSPLARGRRGLHRPAGSETGIIPARAGSTRPRRSCSCGPSDHPRSRGVDAVSDGRSLWSGGSSPLARGRLQDDLVSGMGWWIIPARAGSTGCLARPARP